MLSYGSRQIVGDNFNWAVTLHSRGANGSKELVKRSGGAVGPQKVAQTIQRDSDRSIFRSNRIAVEVIKLE